MRHPVPSSRLERLVDSARGLDDAEVAERRARYGANTILETPPSGWGAIVRDTFSDPMVWFLAGTALLFAWLGDLAEATVLAVALVPIAGMDAYLHRRTQATTEGLSGRLATTAQVLRSGALRDVAAIDLVPGDLVVVSTGSPFPADGVILDGEGLQVDESTLTGESMPVRKRPVDESLAGPGDVYVDGACWGAAGTRLLTGKATLRVVNTGADTVYGQIVRSAQSGAHERTPLQLATAALVRTLVVVATVLCIALAVIRYAQGYGLLDAVLSAVTLAVAALPEEFPIALTFFLGVGVYRLAQRQALVRRAVVVENIGRVTCICTDKTGTLTEGRLRLAHVMPAHGVEQEHLLKVAATAARHDSGDPLDALLLEATRPLDGTVLETFPFTEDRRREVSVIRRSTGQLTATAKGAPETVLAMTELDEASRIMWIDRTQGLAATGHKVIACALRQLDAWPGGEPDRGYHLIGLLAFEDPIREGVADALARARSGGIRVIMVTGDHPTTAKAIAKEIGIGGGEPCVVEGREIDDLLRRDETSAVADIDVIARAVPSQKLDLVRILKRRGEIVAVTGDGVNDVPALQGADIGIAMGERGTRSAREVASIVLLDDNFRTIVRAIAEGRQLFVNLKLSFAYLLMVHAPLVATAALIPLAGFPLLYLPIHIVWLELIIHPTALLVFQQLPTSEELRAPQRRSRLRFFSESEWLIIGLVGTAITVLVVAGYDFSLGADEDVAHGRSMAMVALVVASATVTAGLSRLRSRSAVFAVVATVSSAIVMVQQPVIANLLHMSPLHLIDWIIAGLGGVIAGAAACFIPMSMTASDRRG